MDTTKHCEDKNLDVLTGTNPVPTPCDTVLKIPELRELILSFLNNSSSRLADLKHCALVCQIWQRYFLVFISRCPLLSPVSFWY